MFTHAKKQDRTTLDLTISQNSFKNFKSIKMNRSQEKPSADDEVAFEKPSKFKKLRRPANILLFIVAIMEVGAVLLMEFQFNAICVQTMELGPQVYVLLMCTYTFACPDLFMFVLMFVNEKIFFRPFVSWFCNRFATQSNLFRSRVSCFT